MITGRVDKIQVMNFDKDACVDWIQSSDFVKIVANVDKDIKYYKRNMNRAVYRYFLNHQ